MVWISVAGHSDCTDFKVPDESPAGRVTFGAGLDRPFGPAWLTAAAEA